MMFKDPISLKLTTIPAFRNVNGITSAASNLPLVQGDEQEFSLFLQEMMKDLPKLQIILGYELSGPLRQYLSMHGKALGELSSVLCITGNPGTGKTIATTTLKAVLFGTAGTLSANNTTIGLGRTVEQSGISPVIVDDASVVNKKASEVVEELYHLANGECRVTAVTGQSTLKKVYAPVIQSREPGRSLRSIVPNMYNLDGFEYRMLEIMVNRSEITRDKQAADQMNKAANMYRGQAIGFIREILRQEISSGRGGLVEQYEEIIAEIVEIKQNLGETVNQAYSDLDDRVANRAAVIVLAVRLATSAYNLVGIDETVIIREMLKAYMEVSVARKRSASTEWMRNLLDLYLYGNSANHQCLVDNKKKYNPAEHWGFLEKGSGDVKQYLWIPVYLMRGVVENNWRQYKPSIDNDWGRQIVYIEKPRYSGYMTGADLHKNGEKTALALDKSPQTKAQLENWVA